MIYGNINNPHFEQQAAMLPKPLADVLRYLKTADLENHPVGKFPMALDGVEMILQVMDLTTSPREKVYPEVHRKYIDVQYCVCGGTEKAGYYDDLGQYAIRSDDLDNEKDIRFYENDPDTFENTVYLTPGTYAIYMPWDIHVPGLHPDGAASSYRKIVMKVPVAACL